MLGPAAHERVLDWWATALDRHAQSRPAEERPPIYARIHDRMRAELALDRRVERRRATGWPPRPAAPAISERAWQAAIAGWVRAGLAQDRGAALRADLDRLVTQAIIPERAAGSAPATRVRPPAAMQNEWDAFKAGWSAAGSKSV